MPLSIPNCIHSNRLNVLAQTLRNFTDDYDDNIRLLLKVGLELTGADILVYNSIKDGKISLRQIRCSLEDNDNDCKTPLILKYISYDELKKEMFKLPANRDDNQICYFYSYTLEGVSQKLVDIFEQLGIKYFFMCVNKISEDVDDIVCAIFKDNILTTLADMDTISFISSIIQTQEKNKKINNQLKYQLRFVELLVYLSNDFSRLPNDKMEQAIKNAISQLGKFLKIDRSYLFKIDYKSKQFKKKFEWTRNGIKSWKDDKIENNEFDWVIQHIRSNKVISYKNIDDSDLPEKLKEFLDKRNVKTLLLIPIISHDSNNKMRVGGFFGFSSESTKEFWSCDMKRQMQIVSFMLATALKRLDIYEKTQLLENNLKETLNVWKKERELYDEANEKREKLLRDSLKQLQTLASSSGEKNDKKT